jgi:hypothetical protein
VLLLGPSTACCSLHATYANCALPAVLCYAVRSLLCHAEAVSYFLDACLTLQALTECLPESAALLLNQQHHGELLIVLAAIYSSTLPLLHRVAQQPAAAAVPGLAPARLMRLQHCLESLVFHLLRSAFCTRGGALASGGPAAVAAAAAAATGAPSSSRSSSNSSRKPPGGGDSGGVGFSAETQGQELMNLLMLLAHPSDGIHGAAAAKGNLLAAVNHEFHLDVAVSAAVSEVGRGWYWGRLGTGTDTGAACRDCLKNATLCM